jgi:DNA-binding GntR family transcriptional regulator
MPGTSFVTRSPISTQILPKLRQDIIEGRWRPGDRLPEPLLCEQFGISRTPLRDAFRVLEAEGLLKRVVNVGAVVSRPGLAEAQGSFRTLALLEAGAAEEVARQRPPECLARLREIHARMEHTDHALTPQTYYELNDSFHRTVVQGAGNPVLAGLHEQLMIMIHRLRYTQLRRQLGPTRTGGGHGELLQALEAGDARRAFDTMREHVEDVARRMLELAPRDV